MDALASMMMVDTLSSRISLSSGVGSRLSSSILTDSVSLEMRKPRTSSSNRNRPGEAGGPGSESTASAGVGEPGRGRRLHCPEHGGSLGGTGPRDPVLNLQATVSCLLSAFWDVRQGFHSSLVQATFHSCHASHHQPAWGSGPNPDGNPAPCFRSLPPTANIPGSTCRIRQSPLCRGGGRGHLNHSLLSALPTATPAPKAIPEGQPQRVKPRCASSCANYPAPCENLPG